MLWIEDLLIHLGIKENITGIDIGCGASCVYSLLLVRMNINWKMFALEIDNENVKYAQDNISRNQLSDKVTVIEQENSLMLFEKLFEHDPREKTFCICNPPFFSSSNDVINARNRTGKRKPPKSSNPGSPSEIVFIDGGELGFVKRILNESIDLGAKIKIYSSMFGCKKNFKSFTDELKERGLKNYSTTEFVQGKTTRWGVAWSFTHDLKSFKDHREVLKKPSPSVNILKHEIQGLDFEETVEKLKQVFSDLKIEIKVIEETAECHRWELTALEDTWSKQRRKRRADNKEDLINKPLKASSNQNEQKNIHIAFELRKKNRLAEIQMFYISGTMSKDCTNQILQFIKNKFK